MSQYKENISLICLRSYANFQDRDVFEGKFFPMTSTHQQQHQHYKTFLTTLAAKSCHFSSLEKE